MSEKSLCDRRNLSPHCLANAIIVMRHLQNNAIYNCAARKYQWKAFFLQIDNYEYGLCHLPLELISSWNCRLKFFTGPSPVWGKWSIDLATSWSAMARDCDMIKNMRCDQDQHPWHHNIRIIIIYASLWSEQRPVIWERAWGEYSHFWENTKLTNIDECQVYIYVWYIKRL